MSEQITTCQICARRIKANTGLIAHHGYKRPAHQGWQTSSCMGARALPYEEACNVLPFAIDRAKSFIFNQQQRLGEMMANPPPMLRRYKGGFGSGNALDIPKPDDFNPENIKSMPEVYHFGTYANEFNHMKIEIERSIKEAKIDVNFLEKRLAEWKPKKDGLK